ncbi:TIGR01777 family oxidoreductase [Flavobacteriaceae bacterium]|nr:TIGR01777 family oxidoreductase [Flavobacteriaceae bacterium]MDB4064307.1 TIGR01777 family oxidoreductase [Flavobacteriaceae bacterium]MDB4207368.1 TIGR01777 family oxidoreductase [Flavobacteriaceae bacterium]
MEKVLITGGSGLIGRRLSFLLKSRGYEVRILSRSNNPKNNYKTFVWNVSEQYINDSAFEGLNHIIHLAGAGIADKRWSEKRKKEIIASRVASTNLLYNSVKRLKTPLNSFISASATGYYGAVTSETIFEEKDKPAKDFLGKVCSLWEDSIFQFNEIKIRTVALRTGIVLSKDGGALKKMKTPIITSLGNGKQYMPWIHIDDLCELYIKAIEDEQFKGAFNAVSPEHISNLSFSKKISKIFNYPFLALGAPNLILQIVFGEMSTIILNGSRISANKIKQAGFKFKFENLEKALKNLR